MTAVPARTLGRGPAGIDPAVAALADDLLRRRVALAPPVTPAVDLEPVAPAVEPARIEAELAALPVAQHLHRYKQFAVYVGQGDQLPATLLEIGRLRELTFRAHLEGSGRAEDRDAFDDCYRQIVVWDSAERCLVGGYRLGHSDELLAAGGTQALYLSSMFDFAPGFFEGPPSLEVGRSFVVPRYQRSYVGLYLLWCGIGRYLVRHPRYRRLYGVVSVSRTYRPQSIAVIRDGLVRSDPLVSARRPFSPDLGPVWRAFLASCGGELPLTRLNELVSVLEGGERGLPVLVRHYARLGARFIGAAVDAHFNNTPGLLLTVDLTEVPEKQLATYLGPHRGA